MPLFPFVRALRLAIGVQEQVSAERAAAVLPAEQVEGAAVEAVAVDAGAVFVVAFGFTVVGVGLAVVVVGLAVVAVGFTVVVVAFAVVGGAGTTASAGRQIVRPG